ncbi:PilZ domain-containing protein [Parerythrobacter aestuarii]|uniref:PilZ domain-containing protein n=1 Tax=Parerythrobacter aestuarii TaxID=3020909 RepID=UPI0024DE1F65|nr:PilZ domain-containing protein [Parerythrobacter aestuarii]
MPFGDQYQRREERVELFVMASLHAEASSGPVRLRNISSEGALIESETLPRIGDQVELRRGALTVRGKVIWSDQQRAGLLFDGKTDISQWMPGAEAQKAVDDTFRRLKEEMQVAARAQVSATPTHSSYITTDDMNETAAALDELAEALCEDDAIILKYASKLQALDIAAQLLRKIATRQP